jgi:F-type H+-transporting ATPase subunit b
MNKRIIAAIMIALLVVRTAFAAQEPTEVEQQGVFGGTLADAIWAVIAFAVLLVVLGKVAWKPLLRNLRAREDNIKQQLTDAENSRLKAEQLLDDYKKQSLEIIEQANRYANQTKKEIIVQAGKEATAITQRATSEISNAQNMASQQLWHMAGNMLLAISHEVLGRTMTPDDNKRLIHEAIGKLQEENLKNDSL